eukprot:5560975-Pyramimonas_sp.AAC.2
MSASWIVGRRLSSLTSDTRYEEPHDAAVIKEVVSNYLIGTGHYNLFILFVRRHDNGLLPPFCHRALHRQQKESVLHLSLPECMRRFGYTRSYTFSPFAGQQLIINRQ